MKKSKQECVGHRGKNLKNPYLIIDIPLLVEKEYESLFDRIVVVDCEVEQQVQRVANRDGMDEDTILKIIEQQATRDQRKEVATDILDNSGNVESLLSSSKIITPRV